MRLLFENWRGFVEEKKIEEYKGVGTSQVDKIIRVANK